jgi:hypothetical protein
VTKTGAAVLQGQNYTGTPEEMTDRKGQVIPNKFGVTRRIVGWRLASLEAMSPADMLCEMLPAGSALSTGRLEEALAFAREHGVPEATALAHAQRCVPAGVAVARRPAEAQAAEAPLAIERKVLDFVAADLQTQRVLVDAALCSKDMGALHEEMYRRASVASGDDGAVATTGTAPHEPLPSHLAALALRRARLLWAADLQATLEATCGHGASMAGLVELASGGVAAAAAACAARGDVAASLEILKRHPFAIGRDALRVLSALPETQPVSGYAPLFFLLELANNPGCAEGAVAERRDLDYLEFPQVKALVAAEGERSAGDEGPLAALRVPERLLAARAAQAAVETGVDGSAALLTAQDLDRWVMERVQRIDEATGSAAAALALLQAWLDAGRDGVRDARDAVHLLHCLQRRVDMLRPEARAALRRVGASDTVAMTPPARVRFLLEACLGNEALEATTAPPDHVADVIASVRRSAPRVYEWTVHKA